MDIENEESDCPAPSTESTATATAAAAASDPEPKQREILDPDGDVLIQTSTSKQLLVSSKAMSLASPVFRRMLSSGFKEGDKARSAEDPLVLPLPHDDSVALTLLLKTWHFSSVEKEDWPTIRQLRLLARLADKYDCMQSARPASEPWLQSVNIGGMDANTLWSAISAAYELDHARLFESLTSQAILTHKLTVAVNISKQFYVPGSLQSR